MAFVWTVVTVFRTKPWDDLMPPRALAGLKAGDKVGDLNLMVGLIGISFG